MTTKFTPSSSKNYVLTPEDFGAIGYTDINDCIAAGVDYTANLQSLANVTWQRRERCWVPPLYYRCDSRLDVPAWGEFVMEGSVVSPNTNMTAIKVYGRPDNPPPTGSRTVVSAINWKTNTGINPLWLTAAFPARLDNAASRWVAELPVWNSTTFYRTGHMVTVTGSPGFYYKMFNTDPGNSLNENPVTTSSKWQPLSLATTDGGSQTGLQRLVACQNIGILVESMFQRSVECFVNGYEIGICVKPRATLLGFQAVAWSNFVVHAAESNRVQICLMTGGQGNWINQNKFRINSLTVGNTFDTTGKGLYGVVLMNDDALGNYGPNGNTFDGVDMEHANYLKCSDFDQIVIHKGSENTFRNTRTDLPGTQLFRAYRHNLEGDNPNNNEVISSVRYYRQLGSNNDYANKLTTIANDDIESLRFQFNDLGSKLVYSGNGHAMIRGTHFWDITTQAFSRYDTSVHCFKHYNTNRIYSQNYPFGFVIYPGRKQFNSFWTIAVRMTGGYYGFHCFDSAGNLLTRATPSAAPALIANASATFLNSTILGVPGWQRIPEELNESDPFQEPFHHVRFNFHESVYRAVLSMHSPNIAGFELRAYNCPGAHITAPGQYSDENVVRDPPQKGNYRRPWRAMYEQSPSAGVHHCMLDVGTSASPDSWATSGVWTGGAAAALRDEKHVVDGSDYRIYRCTQAGTNGGSPPTGVVYGVDETSNTAKWAFMGAADQLAAFADL